MRSRLLPLAVALITLAAIVVIVRARQPSAPVENPAPTLIALASPSPTATLPPTPTASSTLPRPIAITRPTAPPLGTPTAAPTALPYDILTGLVEREGVFLLTGILVDVSGSDSAARLELWTEQEPHSLTFDLTAPGAVWEEIRLEEFAKVEANPFGRLTSLVGQNRPVTAAFTDAELTQFDSLLILPPGAIVAYHTTEAAAADPAPKGPEGYRAISATYREQVGGTVSIVGVLDSLEETGGQVTVTLWTYERTHRATFESDDLDHAAYRKPDDELEPVHEPLAALREANARHGMVGLVFRDTSLSEALYLAIYDAVFVDPEYYSAKRGSP